MTAMYSAIIYYEMNRVEMDEGVEVLWASRFSYFDLMAKKVEIGSSAVYSERTTLNLPDCLGSAISLVRLKPRGFYTKAEGLLPL